MGLIVGTASVDGECNQQQQEKMQLALLVKPCFLFSRTSVTETGCFHPIKF